MTHQMPTPESRIEIEINILEDPLAPFDIRAYLRQILAEYKIDLAFVEVTFMDNNGIIGINRAQFQRDYATDVISVALHEHTDMLTGDIYISVPMTRENANTYGNSYENELKSMLIHGMLHIMGYTDTTTAEKRKMMSEQNRLLAKLEKQAS